MRRIARTVTGENSHDLGLYQRIRSRRHRQTEGTPRPELHAHLAVFATRTSHAPSAGRLPHRLPSEALRVEPPGIRPPPSGERVELATPSAGVLVHFRRKATLVGGGGAPHQPRTRAIPRSAASTSVSIDVRLPIADDNTENIIGAT